MLMILKPVIFIILYAVSSNKEDLSSLGGSSITLSIMEIMCWIGISIRINSDKGINKYE